MATPVARLGKGFKGRPGRSGEEPSPNPPPPGVLSRANITVVGCFGLYDNTSDAHAMYNSQGGAAARIRPSDNKLVFLVTRGQLEAGDDFPIYEIEDPLSYSLNYATAPRSAGYPTAKYVGPIRGTRTGSGAYMKSWFTTSGSFEGVPYNPGDPRTFSGGGCNMGALYWNDDTNLLYSTYFDAYNTSGFPDWGLLATDLGTLNATTNVYDNYTTYGPWRIKCTDSDAVDHFGPWRALSLGKHPTTGKMLCGSSLISGNAGCPWGPDMYGGADWPTAVTPSGYGASDIVMPDRYLEHYYMGGVIDSTGHYSGPLRSFRRRYRPYVWEPTVRTPYLSIDPANYSGVGSWTEVDGSALGIWLELTNTKGVLYFGNVCGALEQDPNDPDSAHEWYQTNASLCYHGFDAPLHSQGPVSTHNIPYLMIYNPDDLEAVKNGSLDYTPEPVDFINLEEDLDHPIRTPDMNTGGYKNIGFVHWDASRNYLFCMSLYADDQYPLGGGGALMWVLHIDDVENP